MDRKKPAAGRKANELYITRLYAAPIEAVWDAWTDPEQVAQWWGPRGFTLTTHSKDFRVGGSWVYTMHGPDGVDYPNKTLYHEVEKYSRLVYDHGANDDRPPLFRVTVVFSKVKSGTKMDMTMTLASAEAAAETKKFVKKAGGNSTWDRLAEYLTKEATGKEQFVINRSFAAPRDVVYDMWTNPEHLAQWLPPTGFTMQFLSADLRAGGSSHYRMSGPGGMQLFGRASYLEMERPHRLVYTQQFCDEQGKVSRHPLAPTWPETMITTVTFAEEDDGQTRVTVAWEVHGKHSDAELQAFIAEKAGMTGGWTGSFDKLDEYLATQNVH